MLKALQGSYPIQDVFILPSAGIDLMFNQLRPKYEPVLWGTGTDRMKTYAYQVDREEYRTDLNVRPDFGLFEIPRDEKAVSATQVRNALLDDDEKIFRKLTPRPIHQMYGELRDKLTASMSENKKYITTMKHIKLFEQFVNEATDSILTIYFNDDFNNDWNKLMDFLNSKGNPKWKTQDSLNLVGKKGIIDLNNLISVGGDLNLYGSKITSLGNLQSVGGRLILRDSNIESLEKIEHIGGFLDLQRTKIKSLGELKSVGSHLDLGERKITSLGNLQSVGGYLNLFGTKIKSLGELKSVGGSLYLQESEIESFGSLRSVGGDLNLRRTLLSKKYTKEEIRKMINIRGDIDM
jgi:hypothetical protein